MSIPTNISCYLTKAGIKQDFLAEQTGISENALSLTFSGKRRLLADEYVNICRVLNVPFDFFIECAEQLG